MDTAAILEQYIQDISNFPAELQHLLAELGGSDATLYEMRKKISQKDSAIHKFIKQHGSLTKNPKENQLYPRIREDFKKAEQLQKEKCIIANTALFLTAKHLIKLETDMEKLKSEGLLVSEELDFDLDEDLFSSRVGSRQSTAGLSGASRGVANTYESATPLVTPSTTPAPKKYKKSQVSKVAMPATTVKTTKRQRNEDSKTPEPLTVPTIKVNAKAPKVEVVGVDNVDEDKTLYCFCQNVSFGEMVGCDNDDCKYEWFHYECVGLKEPPKGKWYCADCIEKLKTKEKKKRKV